MEFTTYFFKIYFNHYLFVYYIFICFLSAGRHNPSRSQINSHTTTKMVTKSY